MKHLQNTATLNRASHTDLLPTVPANALPLSRPDEPKAEPELPAEVRQEQASRLTRTFGTRSEKLATLWINQLMSALPAAQDAPPSFPDFPLPKLPCASTAPS